MKALALIRRIGSMPDVDFIETPIKGYCLGGYRANWGAYLLSGTGRQLKDLDNLPQVIGIVAVTESGDVRWPELGGQVVDEVRTKINNWIANHHPSWGAIPQGWTYRRLVKEIYKRLNKAFDLNKFDVADETTPTIPTSRRTVIPGQSQFPRED